MKKTIHRKLCLIYVVNLPLPMARPVKKTKSIMAILAVLVPSDEISDI